MYQKLNYLSSVCTPDYSNSGYMRGNLVTLTLGGWFYEQTGIIQGFTYDVPDESPWEISIGDRITEDINPETTGNDVIGSDDTVKELPLIIRVTGFTFIPIHNFVPRRQQNKYGNSKFGIENSDNGLGTVKGNFGKERYIALSKGDDNNNNYNNITDSRGNNLNYTSATNKN